PATQVVEIEDSRLFARCRAPKPLPRPPPTRGGGMYGVAPGICACPSAGMPRRCHAAAQRRSNGVRVLSAEWGRASMGAAMNPGGKALWYIESHFAGEITLEEIAGVGGVSRYHMSRAFAAAMDCSLSRYVRGRRLTEAARALANGAPDILSVALDWG